MNTPAIGFGNVDAVLSIDADRCGVLDLIFIGKAIERKAFGNRDSFVEIGRDELSVERQKSEERKKKSAWHNFFWRVFYAGLIWKISSESWQDRREEERCDQTVPCG